MTITDEFRGRREHLLGDAIRVLTAAARLERPMLERDEEATAATGQPVWKESGRTEPADWAEFVAEALAAAAANIGGIETVLDGRPGSWEADFVRQLIAGTAGHNGEYLLEHRTEPVKVTVYVDEILGDLGHWKAYDEANTEIFNRMKAGGLFLDHYPVDDEELPELTDEQAALSDQLVDLENRLEELRAADWAAYGEAVKAAVLVAAARRKLLHVPVEISVDLDTYRTDRDEPWAWGIAEQLLDEAISATPLPGGGVPPLERLQAPN